MLHIFSSADHNVYNHNRNLNALNTSSGHGCEGMSCGSVYIPVDSWIYPAMNRLYGLGYADAMFLSMRPYTRQSLTHIIESTQIQIANGDNDEAKEILVKIQAYLRHESSSERDSRDYVYGTDGVYLRVIGVSGQTLRDSYHLGQTIINDYGRPYEPGLNGLIGFSSLVERGRFSLYVRGEYEHAPSASGYSESLSSALSQGAGSFANGDQIAFSGGNLHQSTIPTGPLLTTDTFRLQEASLSYHLLGHEISGGKSDAWLGPAQGGALAWSNNAENIYSARINRVEPLFIPYISKVLGPLRYDFFYGSLKGHTAPNHPYAHSEMFSFRPTNNFEFSFQRTINFGGAGHAPVTLHTFLKSFFDVNDTTGTEKFSRNDPGARFSDFSFSYRLPLMRKLVTFYADSIAHDDVTPPSAPRRAAYRTGLFLSHVPKASRFDFRVEGVSTDPGVRRSNQGTFNYYEAVQEQAYTNKGFIQGDWIGREAKGGQAWINYHFSGNEYFQIEYLNKKTPKDFIPGLYDASTKRYGPGGTTQNSFKVELMKRFHHDDIELDAWFQHESWKAPIYLPGLQRNNVAAIQITYLPSLRTRR